MPRKSTTQTRSPLLPLPLVERLLSAAMSRGADFAEVYVERNTSTAAMLDEGSIKSAQSGSVTGVGVRAIRGAQVGYAYSDDLDEPALLRTAQTAALIADGNREPGPVNMSRTPLPTYYQVRTPLASIDVARKIELLQQADAAARSYDKRVKQVTGAYADQTREILVANTLGHLAEDRQDLCRLSVQCVAFGKKGERRTGFYGGGGRVDFRFFEDFSPQQVGREAARQAVATLGAVPAPSGPQTVVLAPGWSGILLHEAVGHGLEADFIRKGTSLFAGKVGEKVASELVTVIDDGTVSGGRGSINVRRAQGADRERRAQGVPLRSPEREAHRTAQYRVWKTAEFPLRADAAHDEHVSRARRPDAGGDRRRGRQRPLLPPVRRRPGGYLER